MPELYIITGSNGAGKSSVGASYLPEIIRKDYKIFDGDKLYMQRQKELWASGITAHKEAKKLALQFVTETFDQLVANALLHQQTFVYEGHFTNDATWDIPKKFKENGYTTNLIFFGLANPDLSSLRVIDRVKEGGHFVQRQTVEDNFYGNLLQLNKYQQLIDNLLIVDTSETSHIVLANVVNGNLIYSVTYDELPIWFTNHLTNLAQQIKQGNLMQDN